MLQRECNIYNILEENESVFLFGPRGTGKSALVTQWLNNKQGVIFLNLLKDDQYLQYSKDPGHLEKEIDAKFLSFQKLIVTIDEVQRVPLI